MPLEETQRQELIRMRRLAAALLAAVTALFIVSRIYQAQIPDLVWLRVFSEAAMVGAIADWFAVTALFRHPLGIPIPHTAIIPRNKDRIAQTIGSFVQENFLSENALGEKLNQIDFARQSSNWLSELENSKAIAQKISAALPDFLEALTDSDVRRLVNFQIDTLASSGFHISAMAGDLLALILSADRDGSLFNEFMKLVDELLEKHAIFVSAEIKGELPWYIPAFVHEQVYRTVLSRIRSTIRNVKDDPQHHIRGRLLESARSFSRRLKTSAEYQAQGEELFKKLSTSPQLADYGTKLWENFKVAVRNNSAGPDSRTAVFLAESLRSLGQGIGRDPEAQNHINGFLRAHLRRLARDHSDAIVAFISETVSRWDSRTTVDKLELQLGRDLQFIRLNGTIVGGLVGVAIYAVSLLLPI